MAWYGILENGIVWYLRVWYGMVSLSMVLYGILEYRLYGTVS